MIRTEWFPCEDCGTPVVDLGGVLEEVATSGYSGVEQVETGVEHECRSDGYPA